MYLPQTLPVLPPPVEPALQVIAPDSLLLGVVLAVLALGVLASLVVWAYQHSVHAALRSLWMVCASAAALQFSVPPENSLPAALSAPALLLAIACSTAFWARALGLQARSAQAKSLWRAGAAAYVPAACVGAWALDAAVQGVLLWHLLHLAWWAYTLRPQWLGGAATSSPLGATPWLLALTTALQHAAMLGWLPEATSITALWQWVVIFSVGHVALDAALGLPRLLRQTLADRDWQQALLLRYQESASQRLAQHTADLRRALNEAQRADRLQRDMLALLGQEFRQPVTQMAQDLASLKASVTPQPEHLDRLSLAAERLLFISTQLLDHERWRSHSLTPQFTAVDLHAWLYVLLQKLPHLRTATLLAPREALTVEADPVLLEIAVRQLLQGASGPTASPLQLRVTRRAGQAELSIDSDAPSIPAALRARAFERYLCLSGDAGGGLGLGLVRAIALLHDGQVSLTGLPSGGSRFSLSLPLAPEQSQRPVSLRGHPS